MAVAVLKGEYSQQRGEKENLAADERGSALMKTSQLKIEPN